jgi:hypothetical protein
VLTHLDRLMKYILSLLVVQHVENHLHIRVSSLKYIILELYIGNLI